MRTLSTKIQAPDPCSAQGDATRDGAPHDQDGWRAGLRRHAQARKASPEGVTRVAQATSGGKARAVGGGAPATAGTLGRVGE